MKDYSQDTLFGQKIISTISYDEQEIIRDILFLHAPEKDIELDPTYSTGNFYKQGLTDPIHKFDLTPQIEGVRQASSDNLPIKDNSINVIMFDPPFVISGENYDDTPEGSTIISKRFTAFKDFKELKDMYTKSLKEFFRVLKWGGVLIFKCQDIVSSSKNHFTHSWVMFEAVKMGFYPKDLFILLARNRINDGRKQQHARKYHCYYWVFKKIDCPVDYNTQNNLIG